MNSVHQKTESFEQFFKKHQELQMNEEGLFLLINEYLEYKNLRSDFLSFLIKKKFEIEKTGKSYVGDIDQHIKDFE